MNDIDKFLCECDRNSDVCEKLDDKTRQCMAVKSHCPVRLLKIDGRYVCNTMKSDEDKLVNMLLSIIPNNTGFGLYGVHKTDNSITYEFGNIRSKKRVKIVVE
jgi:hypothetical protein